MEITRRNYPGLPQPLGAFHHSVRVGNLLFIAGTTARGTPAEEGDDMAAQTEAVLGKIQHMLEAEGASMKNVVKVVNYVTNIEAARDPKVGEVQQRFYEGAYPVSTLVEVSKLVAPRWIVEINVVAALD